MVKQHIKISALLLVFFIGIAYTQDSSAQQAAGILTSLVREAETNLEEFDQAWSENHPIIRGVLDSVYSEFTTLEQECQTRNDQIGSTDEDLENTDHYIEWIGEKIASNQERITLLEQDRCEASILYVNGLKHNKIAISLIEFMRNAISQRDSLSLIQRRTILKQLSVFFQMYAKNQLKGILMLQQEDNTATEEVEDFNVETDTTEEARTAEEIGTGHIDENGDQIELDNFESSSNLDWPAYKAELLALLDTLETQLQANVASAQDDEVSAGVSLADWKIQIEREIQELDAHLNDQAERINRLNARKVREQAHYDSCIDEINIVFETLLQTRADYDDRVYQHDDRREALASEVQLFQYVEGQYANNINADGDYEEREVDSFSILGN